MSPRGRIAPSPTGLLHQGHAATFSRAAAQMQAIGGTLILRIEDIDTQRCKPAFIDAAIADLRSWGIRWHEGPDVGGPFGPYLQSQRLPLYHDAVTTLWQKGLIYPSPHSRADVQRALSAPHEENGATEPIFPLALRQDTPPFQPGLFRFDCNWRFRVPDHHCVRFLDLAHGPQAFTALRHFGDFLVWRRDGMPSYELAVVVDDCAMQISHVLRGEDLLLSTARQCLLYAAFEAPTPAWFHAPLIRDASGRRLSKRLR